MAEEDALDGVTSDGHSVMSDGTLAAAENPAGASRKKSPSRAKELGARILVFTVQAFAVWQAVALLLLAFAPDFVYDVARALNVTNIPSYPTLLSFFLLTFLSLGLLRRQRAALWLSVVMWQVSLIDRRLSKAHQPGAAHRTRGHRRSDRRPFPDVAGKAATMTVLDTLLWVALPYVSFVVLVAGLLWRYRSDQYGWTSRSSQWNEKAILRWSSPLFHIGVLCVAAGHVVGLAVPASWTEAFGVSQHMYHLGATVLGSIAALMTIVGLAGLVYRRFVVKSVRLATTRNDIVTYVLLTIPIALGTVATVSSQIFGGHEGYNYRETISPWFRSIFAFSPKPELMLDVPVAFKLHIVAGLLLFCIWPFTRLVHVVSAPVGYLTRPQVVYRSRDRAKPVSKPRGW